jgi:hypothetical protein
MYERNFFTENFFFEKRYYQASGLLKIEKMSKIC